MDGLEIYLQETETEYGNDCLIQNCYTVLKCHDKFIAMNIRRYRGWCDNGLDIRGRKEFDSVYDAMNYYNGDLRSM